ncbi:DUF2474 domain-containing protein [Rhizobium ruizarguesonis]|nr:MULTISPECIES: DUF2474 domain-containing protein [Rhizobium]
MRTYFGKAIRRVGWFIGIWLCSVLALAVFALLFRFVMTTAGLTASGS